MIAIGQPRELRSGEVALSEWSPRHDDTILVLVEVLAADDVAGAGLHMEILGRDTDDPADPGRRSGAQLVVTMANPVGELRLENIPAYTQVRFTVVEGAWVRFWIQGMVWIGADDPDDAPPDP